MPVKILKASAGSGKTYNLAKEYIRLLLSADSRDAYRHILAVTFTNKATDEMKNRILKELHLLATSPSASPYYGDLVPSVFADATALRRKAKAMLSAILHDYSSFAVSTIDKFFQQTMRAFSREIGRFASYQVELDRDSLVEESVGRVLDSLAESNRPLLDWIISGVKADLESTGKFSLERRLREMASSLVSLGHSGDAASRERLESLRDTCTKVISSFTDDVRAAAGEVLNTLARVGVNPEDTNRGFLKSLYDYSETDGTYLLPVPSRSFIDKAFDPEKWFAKTKAHLLPFVDGLINRDLETFCALFGERYKEYSTAWTIRSQVYMLGVADELKKAFVEVQKDRNVISIDDTNTILHGIIDGSDTPFIYEKIGVRFEDFLLDEFQDTSTIQWQNFLPLLRGSVASGNETFVVGDVKQSIYRWRGSDWNLLGSELQKEFRVDPKDIRVLDGNYRTCREIVAFNNSFFPWAAAQMDRLTGLNPADPDSVSSIYGDVAQTPCTAETRPGFVKITFTEDAAAEMDAVVQSVRDTLALGADYGDIAVLVRGNAEGSAIAERLVKEGIPVISDDSLYVKSSTVVRRLVSALSLLVRPGDEKSAAGFLAKRLGLTLPTHYHSIEDLCESILADLSRYDPDTYAGEAAYVLAFMDWVHDWTGRSGNSLTAMLREWDEADPKVCSPENRQAVKIMTVHKSKGLEFPYVIFPFAEKVSVYRPSTLWCKPKVGGTALMEAAGEYSVSLSETSENSLFRDDYLREKKQQAVDNINVLYVALTRAKYGLTVIAAEPPKAIKTAVEDGQYVPAKNMSHLLFAFAGGLDNALFGQKTQEPPKRMDPAAPGNEIELPYFDFQDQVKSRLSFRTDGAAFFGKTEAALEEGDLFS